MYSLIGLAAILIAELALFTGIAVVGIYFTPLVWTGYILFVDGLLYSAKRSSLLKSRTKEFIIMAFWSVLCWLIFEAYNLRLENWTYAGLPENMVARTVGYSWSFATIFPAVLLTAELIEWKLPQFHFGFSFPVSRGLLYSFIVAGVLMLAAPLLVSQGLASMMFGLVWLGFILLLDPVNYFKKRRSVIAELSKGNLRLLVSLIISGAICGLLWEFWNYWAVARWVYTIPIPIVGPKLFEMPLLGYLGFLPFAVECFVMYEFFYVLFPRLSRER